MVPCFSGSAVQLYKPDSRWKFASVYTFNLTSFNFPYSLLMKWYLWKNLCCLYFFYTDYSRILVQSVPSSKGDQHYAVSKWMYYDFHWLDTQMCSQWHVVFLSVLIHTGASAGLEKHRSLLWMLNTGLLQRLNLFICHPTMQWEIGDRRGSWACLEEQQQGSFSQMDMCLL